MSGLFSKTIALTKELKVNDDEFVSLRDFILNSAIHVYLAAVCACII